MARVINFFARETMVGSTAGTSEYFSDIFDVSDIGLLTAELQVHGSTAPTTTITGVLQGTSDPTFASGSWQDLSPTLTRNVSGVTAPSAYSGLARFLRAKVALPTNITATVSLRGVGREGA